MTTGPLFVVENQPDDRLIVRECLEQAGYAVQTSRADSAVERAKFHRPSLILISANLPVENGLILCRQFRQRSELVRTPILLLISDNSEEDRIIGLKAGADDCFLHPFSPRELVARVEAVLWRASQRHSRPHVESADVVIDSAAMKLSVRGNDIETTTLEFRLVEYLARHRGYVFTRDSLLDAVWGATQFVTPRSVDTCIRRLRNKIEPEPASPAFLMTVRGVGYRFEGVAVWLQSSAACDCLICARRTDPVRSAHLRIPRSGPASHDGRPVPSED
jgi:DNA-binding response OmpR family regulator